MNWHGISVSVLVSLNTKWSAKKHFCHIWFELLNKRNYMSCSWKTAIHLSVSNSRTGSWGGYAAKASPAISFVDCFGIEGRHDVIISWLPTASTCSFLIWTFDILKSIAFVKMLWEHPDSPIIQKHHLLNSCYRNSSCRCGSNLENLNNPKDYVSWKSSWGNFHIFKLFADSSGLVWRTWLSSAKRSIINQLCIGTIFHVLSSLLSLLLMYS